MPSINMTQQEVRFEKRVVVLVGADNAIGNSLGKLLASRGASIVISDENSQVASSLVKEIEKAGGRATANYNSSSNGDEIIDQVLKIYGSIHVLINNPANKSSDHKRFSDFGDKDWDETQKTHTYGAYKTARAAWPHFKKQRYGRIVNVVSASSLSGSPGHASFQAAELALVGFTETLAKEGGKYNIVSNLLISRPSHSRLTAFFAALLAHENAAVNGAIFEVGMDSIARMRWQRTKPRGFKTDTSLTASAVLKEWETIGDFAVQDVNPDGPWDAMELLEKSKFLPPSSQGPRPDFSGKVAVVTGAGNGLGRQYALKLAELGAKVVVNDLANPQTVVDEIAASGGTAIADQNSVEEGDKIIQTALNSFGGIHILVNNAGILRDKAFQGMTDDLWNIIQNIHLRGSYKTVRAAWDIFVKQKYGRVVNTTSVSGIYGNFGQSNYASAKCGIIGLSNALTTEGKEHNIRINTVGPSAGTQLTRTVMPEDVVQALKPDFVAPFVVALLSDDLNESHTGGLYEIGSGFISKDRFHKTEEHKFLASSGLTLEAVIRNWPTLFKGAGIDYLERIEQGKKVETTGKPYSYTPKDVILYNLGLQAHANQLNWIYENSPHFEVLPTFGVIPYFDPSLALRLENIIPNFSMQRLLHGEQYLEIRKFPIPTSGTLVTSHSLVEAVDKGKAAVVVNSYRTALQSTGEDVFYIEETVFVRGSGNFGGQKAGADRGAATAANKPPSRKPDASVIEKISPDAAALYRLSADINPLHVDPEVAKAGGLEAPILHGLCSFGISGKHIYSTFGPFKNIKVRFNSTVLPGQSLQTDMWKEKGRVIFQTTVVETKKVALAAAAVELIQEKASL